MGTRYLHPISGDGEVEYCECNGVIFRLDGGAQVFYIKDNNVFSYSGGNAIYWIDGNYLYAHGSGQPHYWLSEDVSPPG